MSSSPIVRHATLADAAQIARLSTQLGYPASVEVFATRLQKLLDSPTHAVLVAVGDDGRLVGFVATEQRITLELGERVEIVALVVDAEARRGGVGKALIAAAEQWAQDIGTPEVFLRSNILRPEAHPFYERLGYTRTKTQHAYHKPL
ncbi:N-acetylglutamate synthase-like GNAT family acetyltransferase [Luteimonas cucumeris]|uniref:N-acetylglutamate synthase-like GNAT family acetyltransferase n=1 Tax=Luteimonas cucumeris TaxID=985012 RepID=A0A562KX18_9GAMM|nr:GNAT family N-acetyltransferase [Luteimonas cucumeris]TWH99951.1 N-acetylglutamate synthase-like GNAT family acetyltransferase [Luteimonas cucumeris]